MNNFCIIYNVEHNYYRTYEYYHNIFIQADILDISDNTYKEIMTDYSGNIYELSVSKNDYNNEIKYIIRTKEFNIDTNVVNKAYKIVKVHGKYFENIRITYWIDDVRQTGEIIHRRSDNAKEAAFTKVWGSGRANTIIVEISGVDLDTPPILIDEILIGYDRLAGVR